MFFCLGRSAQAPPEAKSKRSIADVGDGLLEGAGALGTGFLKGFKGLVSKPIQGAKQEGMQGGNKHEESLISMRACLHKSGAVCKVGRRIVENHLKRGTEPRFMIVGHVPAVCTYHGRAHLRRHSKHQPNRMTLKHQ